MSLVRWNPSRDVPGMSSDLLSMQREMNRIFDNIFRSGWSEDTGLAPLAWSPATDVIEQENEYIVRAELPGVSRDDVSITLQENTLTIRGDKKLEKESKEKGFHRVERSYGSFQRSFRLPSTVKQDGVDASFRDGVLTVTLPKAEEARAKQIDVRVK